MFNGIIKHKGEIKKIVKDNLNCVMHLESNLKFKPKDIGSSICCSGACLTLDKFNKKISQFYISKETMNRTNFKYSKIGDFVNLEKSLSYGDKISGHYVQGHVDATSIIKKIKRVGKSWVIDFYSSKKYNSKYIVEKGSISVNGISLTIAKILKNGFRISVIPKTLELTNLNNLKEKDVVNIEFDVMAKYIHNFLK